MQTVAAFIFAIGILVAVHELGHYGVAVACGVKVLRFSVGFGPRLLGWTSARSGTEFVVGLLPLGGYVKMLDEREGAVLPHERARAFNVQPVRIRAAIVAAGPLANLIFAVVLYSWVNWSGVEQAQAVLSRPAVASIAARAGLVGGEQVRRVAFDGDSLKEVVSFEDFRWWLTRAALAHRNLQVEYVAPGRDAHGEVRQVVLDIAGMDTHHADVQMFRSIGILGPFSQARLGDLAEAGAAKQAGLQSGDWVLRVDQLEIVDAGQLRDLIRASGSSGTAGSQAWLVERAGTRLTIAVSPKVEREGDVAVGRVGAYIGAQPAMKTVRYGPSDGVERAITRTWEVSVLTLNMMGQILTGDASLKNLSGPLTIADYAGKSAAVGFTPFVIFLALISISLGVLNLLPLPVLDGGHLMYYLWELLTGKPVSESWMERFQKLGLAVLLLMMTVAIFNDVMRLVG
ncbi:MAG: RIP metalloprotease RseP [Rhodoferax sp.]|nr:RIP metalloprotease RseP [Rhodoferax sp.]MDP3654325.1 RIP metalloprotease RseP [Rhodoferax sp.]